MFWWLEYAISTNGLAATKEGAEAPKSHENLLAIQSGNSDEVNRPY